MPADPELIPGALPVQRLAERAPTNADLERDFGRNFLVVIGGGKEIPRPMQRTSTFEEGDDATAETRVLVVPLRARSPDRMPNVTLGRAPSNDIVVLDTTVSKLHTFFKIAPDRVSVCDAGSHNGTLVDAAKAPQRGVGEPLPLRSPSTLRVGGITLIYMGLTEMGAMLDRYRRR